MPSLHWILVLTLALLHYLAAYPTPAQNELQQQKMDHLQDVIEKLNKTNCKEEFYSPSNVKPACTVSAVKCSMKELTVLESECFDNITTNRQLVRKAQSLITSILKTPHLQTTSTEQPTDCSCEVYEEKPYKEFLRNLWKLIQQLNVMS